MKTRDYSFKLPRVYYTVEFILILFISNTSGERQAKSLFDTLPLNGALPVGAHSNHQEEKFSTEALQRDGNTVPETKIESDPGSKSLFDFLPNQGAILAGGSKSGKVTKSEVKDLDSISRTQRHSLTGELLPPALGFSSEDFEIEHKPVSDLSLSFFNSNLLPPLIRKLTQDEAPRSRYGAPAIHSTIPILSGSSNGGGYSQSSGGSSNGGYSQSSGGSSNGGGYSQSSGGSSNGGGYSQSNGGSSNGGGYSQASGGAEPVLIREVSANGGTENRYSSAVRSPGYKKPSLGAAASSSGSTVIVYANGPSKSEPSNDPPAPNPPSGSYGPPRDDPPPKDRNKEIHYHYHINSNNNNEKSRPPAETYGAPRPTAPPRGYVTPPRGSYGSPPRLNGPPRNIYIPQSRLVIHGGDGGGGGGRGGGEAGGYNSPPQQNNPPNFLPAPEGYSSSRDNSGQSDFSSQQNTPSFAEDFRRGPDNNAVGTTNERFISRTLQTGNQDPSLKRHFSYGPPPSSSYGPPPPLPPVYGPPSTPPPPPPPNDQGQAEQTLTQTSITLETIPITTTSTQFVTVPKITQTVGSSQNSQFDSALPPPNTPPLTGGYGSHHSSGGPPAPPPGSRSSSSSASPLNTRNILSEQLLQLSPAPSRGLSDFSDLDILSLLQQSSGDGLRLTDILTPNNRGSLLTSTLRANLPDFRTSHLGLGSDLRTSNLGLGSAGLTVNNNLPILNGLGYSSLGNFGGSNHNNQQQQSFGGGLRGTSPILTGDAVGAISDLIREQRLQQTVADLRHRLRYQKRDTDRTRQTYRNLFYKGALLLGGLSLIPSVASVAGPLAAATGASSALTSSLLPLTTGRRKRSTTDDDSRGNNDILSSSSSRRTCSELPPLLIPMPRQRNESNNNTTWLTVKRRNCTDPSKRVSFKGKLKVRHGEGKTAAVASLLDSMPFKGAIIPEDVQADLQRFLPLDEILQSSQCIQKYFCENLLEIEALQRPHSALLLLSALTSDIKTNPWLQEAMTAARNRQCTAFYCHVRSPIPKKYLQVK